MRSVLFAMLLSLPFAAQAQTPADSLKAAVAKITEIGKLPEGAPRVSGLCQLAAQAVDFPVVGQTLLGSTFAGLTRDAQGIAQFTALVPSLIVNDFYTLVNSNAGQNYWVDTTTRIPKGSGRVGYKVMFGGTALVITMSTSTLKIVDAEWNNISLVKKKGDEYQKIMQAAYDRDRNNSMPVTELVTHLLSKGDVVRCN